MQKTTDNSIVIKNLTFSRNSRLIFDNISLTIPRGKITGIMGPSGTGKTTLLKLIGGQLVPDKGEVIVEDLNVNQLSRSALYELRRKMGMLFQSGALFTHLNVFENIAFPLREHTRLPPDMLRDLVLIKLEAVGLRGAQNLMPSQLSGGMARRVALARALALDPQIMLYDEPFTGQDPITLGVLAQLIKNLNNVLGLTSILVSHDVTETINIADYIYLLSNGKIVSEGTPQEIMQDKGPEVFQFMHGLPDGAVPFHYPTTKKYSEDLLQ